MVALNVFQALLVASQIGALPPTNLQTNSIYYYTEFRPSHQECISLGNDLMICPSNDLNRGITPSEQIDQEVQAWRVPAGCNELSDNVSLCK
jgi:hypothetical protein